MSQAPETYRFTGDYFIQDGSSFAFLLGPKHTKEGPLLALILELMTTCMHEEKQSAKVVIIVFFREPSVKASLPLKIPVEL